MSYGETDRRARVRACAVLAALGAGLIFQPATSQSASTNLFISGQGGYNTYRIPALYETTNGTLLAFCEGRKNSRSDTGDIDTLLRRSFDGGATWTAQQVVWSDGPNTCGNPTVVQDRTTGRIWLFLTWNNGQDSQSDIQDGTSIDVRKIYSCYSDSDGATWSAPVSRFAEVQPASTRWDATGPGRGIQMVGGPYPGRLIIPANGRNIQSDDKGENWSQSTRLPSGSSESQEVEIAGGVLLRNDRASGGNTTYKARVFCRSYDQGASWTSLEVRQDLTCPVCQASTIAAKHPNGLNGRMLVFSNPSSTTRDHMTIKFSLDDGVTWPISHEVYSGSSAYSCLSTIGTNKIGLLYERDSYGRITFEEFSIAQLLPLAETAVWNGGAGSNNESWQHAANWVSNAVPALNSSVEVMFHAIGAGNLTNALGSNCTLRSLVFNADADAGANIYLADKINSPTLGYALTFDAGGRTATNTIAAGAAGDFIIGVGGAAGFGSVVLADNLVVHHNGSGELRFDRPVSGPGGVTKNGSGRLFLRQSNLYTGSTVINAGIVITGGNTGGFGTASNSGPMQLNGGTMANSTSASRPIHNNVTMGGDFTFGGVSGYGAGLLTLFGTLDLGGATRLFTINSPVTISGTVANGGLTKNGSGTLSLTASNAYAGPTTIYAGILQLGDGGGSGSLDTRSTVAIGPNGALQYNRTSNLGSFSNTILGTGTLIKTNTGELGLSGTNSFSGRLEVQQGKIALSGAACVNGSPNVNLGANGTLSIGAGFIGGTAVIGNLNGAGRIDPAYSQGAGIRTLQVNQNSEGVFSGAMLDATSGRVLGFMKGGLARLTLSGTNTYTGPTTVSNGTLVVNGVITTSAVSVKAGATLAGTGFLGGPVTVEADGTLAPNSSPGTLTISNSLTLSPGSLTALRINATNGLSDRVEGLAGASYAGRLVVTNIAGPGTLTKGQTFHIFSVLPAATGNFASITAPATPGVVWGFAPASGLLTVLATTATYRTNLSLAASNGALSLTWPETHLGWIAQSNASSLANSAGWHDIPGSSSWVGLTISPGISQTHIFYRLISP